MSEKIKVLVVDDSSFMRNMLSRLLMKDERFEVIGKAEDGEEGVALAKSLKPDVITMDIEMPKMNGIEALKVIMKETPTPVVMVSSLTREGATATLEAMDYGAVDFIPKAMEEGAGSVLNNRQILTDKIYAASRARIGSAIRKPSTVRSTPIASAIPQASSSSGEVKTSTKTLLSTQLMVIGSSTGGPRALQEVIPHLPASLKVPVVIAQHMPAHFTGPMAERLNSISKLKVVEGQDGDELKAGTVYVSPGGMHARIEKKGTSFVLSIKEDQGGECVYKPSVTILADSATKSASSKVLAVMLTGMGNDGAEGFASLKKAGSYVVAQDRETSVVYGMPKAVEPIADEVLPLNDIGKSIIRLIG